MCPLDTGRTVQVVYILRGGAWAAGVIYVMILALSAAVPREPDTRPGMCVHTAANATAWVMVYNLSDCSGVL